MLSSTVPVRTRSRLVSSHSLSTKLDHQSSVASLKAYGVKKKDEEKEGGEIYAPSTFHACVTAAHSTVRIDECSSSTSRSGQITSATSSCPSKANKGLYADSCSEAQESSGVAEHCNSNLLDSAILSVLRDNQDLSRTSFSSIAETRTGVLEDFDCVPTMAIPTTNVAIDTSYGTTVDVSSVPITAKEEARTIESDSDLRAAWNKQSKLRHKGKWKPSGGWKAPQWANWSPSNATKKEESVESNGKEKELNSKRRNRTAEASCSKAILTNAAALLAAAMPGEGGSGSLSQGTVKSLTKLKWNGYTEVSEDLLMQTHAALNRFLPDGDCDSYEVVKLARAYYDFWRPSRGNIRVILLAESHSFTETERALSTGLSPELLRNYLGPRNYIQLVYCLAYGENDALYTADADTATGPNPGTSQFWTLFAACARGTDYVPSAVVNGLTAKSRNPFALDVLKAGGLKVEDRLQAKYSILNSLKARGIWLLDVSIIGW